MKKILILAVILFSAPSVYAQDSVLDLINRTSAESQPLNCVNDSLSNAFTAAAGTCRIIGTVNSGSGLGVSVNFSISGGTVSGIDVTRDNITFHYDKLVTAHSEISGPCFAAHYTVKATFTDGSTCTVSTSGTAPHSACTDTAIANSVTIVSAASYQEFLAPDSIASAFGNSLTTFTTNASSLPLPENLGDVEAYVFFNTPRQQKVKLFYVSPTQINVLLPKEMATGGKATLQVVNRTTDTLKAGFFYSLDVVPSVFTTTQNGNGVAAGYWVGNILVLYATGINDRTCGFVRQGQAIFPASFVGHAPGFVGLYQINVPLSLPRGSQAQLVIGCGSNNLSGSQLFLIP